MTVDLFMTQWGLSTPHPVALRHDAELLFKSGVTAGRKQITEEMIVRISDDITGKLTDLRPKETPNEA